MPDPAPSHASGGRYTNRRARRHERGRARGGRSGRVFVVSAVVVRDAHERILTVRKRGTAAFMLPGGKIEAGETPHAAALRELREEVGLRLQTLSPLRRYDAPAANEPGWRIDAWVFTGDLPAVGAGDGGAPAAAAEIAELRWADPWRLDEWPPGEVAPLLRDVLPDLTTYDVVGEKQDGSRTGAEALDLATALRPEAHRQGRRLLVRVARGEEASAVAALAERYGRRRVRRVADGEVGGGDDGFGSGTSSTWERST